MPAYGAYSEDIVLARPDGRSKEGRLLRQMRQALFDHLGGEASLTPPQRMLVERAAMLQLRLAVFDQKVLAGSFSEFDAKVYNATNNSLVRTLATIGVKGSAATAAAPPMDALAYGRLLDERKARERAA